MIALPYIFLKTRYAIIKIPKIDYLPKGWIQAFEVKAYFRSGHHTIDEFCLWQLVSKSLTAPALRFLEDAVHKIIIGVRGLRLLVLRRVLRHWVQVCLFVLHSRIACTLLSDPSKQLIEAVGRTSTSCSCFLWHGKYSHMFVAALSRWFVSAPGWLDDLQSWLKAFLLHCLFDILLFFVVIYVFSWLLVVARGSLHGLVLWVLLNFDDLLLWFLWPGQPDCIGVFIFLVELFCHSQFAILKLETTDLVLEVLQDAS